jgi:hypothetical protein
VGFFFVLGMLYVDFLEIHSHNFETYWSLLEQNVCEDKTQGYRRENEGEEGRKDEEAPRKSM